MSRGSGTSTSPPHDAREVGRGVVTIFREALWGKYLRSPPLSANHSAKRLKAGPQADPDQGHWRPPLAPADMATLLATLKLVLHA